MWLMSPRTSRYSNEKRGRQKEPETIPQWRPQGLVMLVCTTCGQSFTRRRAAITARTPHSRGYFCSRRCTQSKKQRAFAAGDAGLARPVGAAIGAVRPVGYPLVHVPPHVEHAPARLAVRPRARVDHILRRNVAVRREDAESLGAPARTEPRAPLASRRREEPTS